MLASRRTNSGAFDHIADSKPLYRLILGGTSRAVGASNRLDVTSPFLVAATTALLSDCSWSLNIVGILGCSLFDHDCGSAKLSIHRSQEARTRVRKFHIPRLIYRLSKSDWLQVIVASKLQYVVCVGSVILSAQNGKALAVCSSLSPVFTRIPESERRLNT